MNHIGEAEEETTMMNVNANTEELAQFPIMNNNTVSSTFTSSLPVSSIFAGTLARYPAAFTRTRNSLLAVPCASTMKLYSLISGNCVGILVGHTDDVTSILLSAHTTLQCYTTSLDGTIRRWNLYEQRCIATIEVGAPIVSALLVPSPSILQEKIICLLNPRLDSEKKWKLKHDDRIARSTRIVECNPHTSTQQFLYKAKACHAIALSPDGAYIASISNRTLTLFERATARKIRHHHTHNLTCVSFHPLEKYLSTGDEIGKVLLWYRYEEPQPVLSFFHWHAHAVLCCEFTPDGAYLMSGGEESVCVLWQLDSGHKQFIPRLSAAISHITVSPNALLYAVSCADNSIRIIDSVTSKVLRVIHGLQFAHTMHLRTLEQNLATGMIPFPSHTNLSNSNSQAFNSNGFIVLNGRPGVLQVYDVFRDQHIYEFDILQENIVSRTEDSLMIHTVIEHVAITNDGEWMMTAERRTDGEFSELSVLKLWRWTKNTENDHKGGRLKSKSTESGGSYLLHMRMDKPHSLAVCAITVHPALPIFVTCSRDMTFKLWTCYEKQRDMSIQQLQFLSKHQRKTAPHHNLHSSISALRDDLIVWTCVAEGYYRDYAIRACAFSSDGSVLAITHGQVVTLWTIQDTNANGSAPVKQEVPRFQFSLQATLLHPSPSSPVLRLAFLPNTPYLITATNNMLYSWNLISCTLNWSIPARVTSLKADVLGRFAVTTYPFSSDNEKPTNSNAISENSHHTSEDPHLLLFFTAQAAIPTHTFELTDIRIERSLHETNPQSNALTAFINTPTSSSVLISTSFCYINERKQIVRFDLTPTDKLSIQFEGHKIANILHLDELKETLIETRCTSVFEKMFGTGTTIASHQEETTVASNSTSHVAGRNSISSLFASPSHILPPISLMLPAIFATLLPPADATSESMDVEDDETSQTEKDERNPNDPKATSNVRQYTDDEIFALETKKGTFAFNQEVYGCINAVFSTKSS